MNQNILKLVLLAQVSIVYANEKQCEEVELPEPSTYIGKDWNERASDQFKYLSRCSPDGRVSFAQGRENLDMIMRQTMEHPEDDGMSNNDIGRLFVALDLDEDELIVEEEYMQYMRSVYDPVNLKGEKAPYYRVMDKLFLYMAEHYAHELPQPGPDEQYEYRTISYWNFAAMQPILFPDRVGDKELLTREWRLRDYNCDGVIDYVEYNDHIHHYMEMMRYWNWSKREDPYLIDRETYEPIMACETLSREEFVRQSNPWKRRYAEPDALIPWHELEEYFHYFDIN